MNKLIEDWIVNEILDTLRQARISLLGITALDSPLELQRKTKENSTAITRRIEKVLDLIDPSKLSTDWNEEDELMRSAVLNTLDRVGDVGTIGMQKNWLKSFPRSTSTKEQPVDWQKVAEAFTKDQPLGQDNNGNLVYPKKQPICERLEEEIKRWLEEGEITDTRYDDYGDNDIEVTARHFAQWMREKMMKDGLNAVKSGESNMIEKTIAGVFVKYGMDKQKEIMLREAVEGWVSSTKGDHFGCVTSVPTDLGKLYGTDKCKIIIVKED